MTDTNDSPEADSANDWSEAAKPYVEKFGEHYGPLWFTGGIPFQEAKRRYAEILEREHELLLQRVSALEAIRGEPEDEP